MDAAMFTPERDGQSLGQLVLRKRPPVVFQDLDGNLDTGLGGDQLTELALVVILYQYDAIGGAQYFRHFFCRKRAQQPDLQKS